MLRHQDGPPPLCLATLTDWPGRNTFAFMRAREMLTILRRLGATEPSLEPCLGKDWLKKIIREGN